MNDGRGYFGAKGVLLTEGTVVTEDMGADIASTFQPMTKEAEQISKLIVV